MADFEGIILMRRNDAVTLNGRRGYTYRETLLDGRLSLWSHLGAVGEVWADASTVLPDRSAKGTVTIRVNNQDRTYPASMCEIHDRVEVQRPNGPVGLWYWDKVTPDIAARVQWFFSDN